PGVSAADVLLAVTSLSFDISGLELYLLLVSGGRVIISPRDAVGDGEQLLALIRQHGVTMLQATPATWRLLLAAGWKGGEGLQALCGGEALSPDLAAAIKQRAKTLWNMYGPTETTIWSTLYAVDPNGATTPTASSPAGVLRVSEAIPESVPIGRPVANTRVYLLDAVQNLVAVGVTGELFIGGAGLALGYHKRPDLTAERFVPDPFSQDLGARMYRSGDLARYRPDGNVEFLGRIDHQVKIRGYRLELGEIEAVLAKHPAVSECVAVALMYAPAD